MKKISLFLLALTFSLVLVACGDTEDTSNNEKEGSDDNIEQTEDNAEEKEPIDKKVEVNKELNFEKFDVVVKAVEVYEKDNSILADIKLNWTNRANDYGDEMTFFVATLFDVRQGDTELSEINDSWNPENQRANDVFFPNALSGNTDVNLTYELKDETTPIDIIFTPTTETEGSETVTVEI